MKHWDEVDTKILQLLQADGRMTNADLAKNVGLTPPSALQRVRALEKAGLIKGYTALLDSERLGLRLTAFTFISLALHQDLAIERFRKSVSELGEVMECYNISGDFDFILKVLVRDIRSYEIFVREKLSRIKGVGKIQTSFVIGTPKQTTKIPI